MTLRACCSSILSNIKRQMWVSALWFTILFFYLPVQTVMVFQNYWSTFSDLYQNSLIRIIGLENEGMVFLLMGMAFVSALVFCSYMHKQKQVDFYHSQPISRERLLLQHAAAGFASVFIPYLLNLVLTLIAALIMGLGPIFPWGSFFSSLAIHTLGFTAVFAIILFAIVISGKVAVAGITGVFLLAFLPTLVFCIGSALDVFYPVSYGNYYGWETLFGWLSPIMVYLVMILEDYPPALLPLIFYIVLALTGAVLLYRRRSSEAAGDAIAFEAAKPLLKYAMAILAAGFFALFFYNISDSVSGYFWWYFGAIVGGFLSTQITEIVYAADFRALLRNMRGLAVFLIIYLGITTCAVYDISGFNGAVPQADQVVSAQIRLTGVQNYQTTYYWYAYSGDRYYIDEYRVLEWNGERENLFPVTSQEALAAVVNIATRYASKYAPEWQPDLMVTEAQLQRWEQEGREYLLDYWNVDYEGFYYDCADMNWTSFSVVYTLKNGRKMARDYNNTQIPVQFLMDDLAVIYEEEGFRAATARVLMHPDEHYLPEHLEFFELYYGLPPLDWKTEEMSSRLISALRADTLELTLEQQQNAMPIGSVRLRLYGGPAADPQKKPGNISSSRRPYRTFSWPIYATFHRTLALLEENGLGQELFQPQLDDIKSITLSLRPAASRYSPYAYSSVYSLECGLDEKNNPIVVTDPEKIAEIMAKSYSIYALQYNSFIDIDGGIEIEVQYEGPGGQKYTNWRVFPYVLP